MAANDGSEATAPPIPELGIDIIKVQRIRDALARFGARFSARVLTPSERGYVRDRPETFAGRWAAKEAVIKAWSGSRFSRRPVLPEGIHRDIEVITDMWGRPKVRLTGAIAEHLKDVTIHLSLTHEADTAAAVAILEER